MAVSQTKLNDDIRQTVIEVLTANLLDKGEDVCRVASNKIAFPTLDATGDDKWVVLTVSVPKDEYDGYTDAEFYKEKCEDKALKDAERKAKAEAKAKKDAERRAKKKEQNNA